MKAGIRSNPIGIERDVREVRRERDDPKTRELAVRDRREERTEREEGGIASGRVSPTSRCVREGRKTRPAWVIFEGRSKESERSEGIMERG